jgi:uncharacterized protein
MDSTTPEEISVSEQNPISSPWAVDASAELSQTSHFVAQFCLEHNLLVSRFFLPRSRFETENSPLLKNIQREGILL